MQTLPFLYSIRILKHIMHASSGLAKVSMVMRLWHTVRDIEQSLSGLYVAGYCTFVTEEVNFRYQSQVDGL